MTGIKICGITTHDALIAAVESKADYIGLMMWEKSPRALTAEQARFMALMTGGHIKSVAVFVNPHNDDLDAVIPTSSINMIQLHGTEDPQRIAEIKARYGLPVIKAIRVATATDLQDVEKFEDVADWLLFDAKVDPKISILPGGTGLSFDWQILEGRTFRKPWMLSGGLHAGNVGRALSLLGPDAVDISSGVEDKPGLKNPLKIKEFCDAVLAGVISPL